MPKYLQNRVTLKKSYQNTITIATIKSFTDLSQSKKLAEILPLKSADMVLLHEEPYETSDSKFDGLHQALYVPFNKYGKSWRQKYKNISYFPCWSLAALLDILSEGTRLLKSTNISSIGDTKYHCDCPKGNIDMWFDNPVDACVTMIEKLKELNLL